MKTNTAAKPAALHLVTTPAAKPRARKAAKPAPSTLGAKLAGAILGGFVPLASAALSHCEVTAADGFSLGNVVAVALVLGALAYSFPSVYQLTRKAFGCAYKAAGFTVLLEGMYTVPTHSTAGHAAAIGALVLLVAINAIKAAKTLAKSE